MTDLEKALNELNKGLAELMLINLDENELLYDYIFEAHRLVKNLSLSGVSKRTFRKAKPSDIVVGNTVYLLGDGNEIYTQTIDEVLRPNDMYKAYVASDGCRYGLDSLYVC
mgnify:CR=1 FL=1|tara:strand:- start:225 stop:557 length:333 start_codon:yes stop_codon:yes gene_type:complete